MKKIQLPPIGLRMIKSSIGVLLGFIVYYLRGCQGTPFYTALAVLWCMRSNIKDSKVMAYQRALGTLIGGIYGFIILMISIHLQIPQYYHFLLCSIMIIPIIYTTLLIKKKNASYFACVVFLSVVVNHIGDTNPYLFVFNRVLDTLIGIILSLIINLMHIPRKKNKDILFVSGIDDVLVNSSNKMSDYSLRSINNMINDGMMFTLSSLRTVPVILESVQGMNINMPIIAMDGAVLFDIKNKKYLRKYEMSHEKSVEIISFIRSMGFHVFINSIFEDSWIINYGDFCNEVEKEVYENLRGNPYRNYYKHDLMNDQKTVYLMVIDKKERVEYLYEKMKSQIDISNIKLLKYDSLDYQGYTYLKIYDQKATRENMLKELMNLYHINKVITFGSIKGQYDIVVDHSDANVVAKTLDKLYQPVFYKSLIKNRIVH